MLSKTITIWDADTPQVKAADLVIGRFYRVTQANRSECIGALACRTNCRSLSCWIVDPKVAYSISTLDSCDDYRFVEAQKNCFLKQP